MPGRPLAVSRSATPKMGPKEGQDPSRIKAVNRGRADVGRGVEQAPRARCVAGARRV